jgi:hypothetical protein
MRAASDARPVSRILYGVAAADGHSSRPLIAERLKRPTRKLGAPSRHALRMACAISSSFPIWSCSVWGLPCLAALLRERCALTAPFHPYPELALRAVYFLWHFPSSHFSVAPKRAAKAPSRTLSGTLLCGVRTFLSLGRAARGNPRRPQPRQRPSGPTSATHIIR